MATTNQIETIRQLADIEARLKQVERIVFGGDSAMNGAFDAGMEELTAGGGPLDQLQAVFKALGTMGQMGMGGQSAPQAQPVPQLHGGGPVVELVPRAAPVPPSPPPPLPQPPILHSVPPSTVPFAYPAVGGDNGKG